MNGRKVRGKRKKSVHARKKENRVSAVSKYNVGHER